VGRRQLSAVSYQSSTVSSHLRTPFEIVIPSEAEEPAFVTRRKKPIVNEDPPLTTKQSEWLLYLEDGPGASEEFMASVEKLPVQEREADGKC
jgi:hypothetical protein